jgi:hypothetical protein
VLGRLDRCAENKRLAAPSAELEDVMREAQATGEMAPAAATLRKFSAEVEQGLTDLESLEAPAAQWGLAEAVIATEAGQVELPGDLADAFEAEDRTAAQKVETRLSNSKEHYGAQTAKLGFKVCGARSR